MAILTKEEAYAIWKAAKEKEIEAERKKLATQAKIRRAEQKRLAEEEAARNRFSDRNKPPRPKPRLAYSDVVRVDTERLDSFYENTGALYDPFRNYPKNYEGDYNPATGKYSWEE